MGLLHYLWSRTAANNATADAQVNWQEGQAPSSVNDSARAMMASLAAYRDDISGAIVTGGTSTNYTVTSYQVFNSLANMNGQMIAFTPHTTNGAGGTNLNVDGLGLKPLYTAPLGTLPAGLLIQGTPYVAVYNSSDAAFYLHGVFGNPYSIPIAGGIDFWGATAPNSSFAFPAGQAISRSTYSVLFGIMGTTYGVGDGSTTFNLPDKTGRVSAMKEASGTRLTSTYFVGNSANLGAVGGLESNNVILTHTHSNSLTDPGHFHVSTNANDGTAGGNDLTVGSGTHNVAVSRTAVTTTGVTITNASAGSASAHNIVQPTIITNYIIRII